MGVFFQDIRYGIRMLLKSPITTLVAVITLALGIGANTTIFSILNGFMLRPLPVASADRLVIFGGQQQGGDTFTHYSYADFKDIRSQADGFSHIMAYTLTLAGMEYQGRTEPVVLSYVSGNFFQDLGLKPAQGVLIHGEGTELPSTEHVVVLGHGYWKKRFNADPTIIGQQVKMNGHTLTV